MSVIAQTMSLVDKMSPNLTRIQRSALDNINTFNRLSTEVDNLKKSLDAAEKANPNIVKSDMYANASEALFKMEGQLEDVANGQTKLNSHIQDGSVATDKLTSSIGRLAKAYISFRGLSMLVNMSDQMVQTTARLGMMNDEYNKLNKTQQTTSELQDLIYAKAQESRASYTGLSNTIAQLGNQATDAFANTDELVFFSGQLNKLFKSSGLASTQIESTMYNLTQSLASGSLMGQDYRILKMNAPQIIKYLEDYYGVARSQLDKMVSDGKVSASDIKNAIFNATDDINEKFESMPLTWSDVWTSISNATLKLLDPVLKAINWVANNMEIIGPLVLGVAGAFLVYSVAAHGAEVATKAWSAAQAVLDALLALNPVALVIMGIVLLIGLIYTVVGAINKVKGTTISATGVIMGALSTLGALVINVGIFLINMLYNVAATIVSSISNAIGIALEIILGFAHVFTRVLQGLASIWDMVFNTHIADGIQTWVDNIEKAQQSVADTMLGLPEYNPIDYVSLTDAYKNGYNLGENMSKGLNDGSSMDGLLKRFDNLTGTDPTGKEALNVTSNDKLITEEDIQLLLDMATSDYKVSYQQMQPNITLTFGDIHETADIDDVMDVIADNLEEIYASNLEVVH